MKINDLLKEIEDILDSAGGFPLTGKVIVDPDEISDILKEIKNELPEEIQQAQWIKNQQQRIMDESTLLRSYASRDLSRLTTTSGAVSMVS